MSDKYPCLGCTKRHVGCHADCKEYAERKKESQDKNAALHAAKSKDNLVSAYTVKVAQKTKKYSNQKKGKR